MKPPGNDRLSFMGDKTVEFYANPKSFIECRVAKYNAPVFQQRFLNKPTIWLTDHAHVNSLLISQAHNYDQGFDVLNILPQLFGTSCVLFQNGPIVSQLRDVLASSITGHSQKFESIINEKVLPATLAACMAQPEDLYQSMKGIITKMSLEYFFDIDPEQEPELITEITRLSIEHWHGIMSIPTNIKIVGHKFQNSLKAKERLTQVFRERLHRASKPPPVYTVLEPLGEDLAVDHVIVFISALLPKAMASLLTSSLVQIAMHEPLERREPDTEFLDAIIKESYRLYPPFFGGRKVAKHHVKLNDYDIEQGQGVIYMSYFAHRDPKVFAYPEEFVPERWLDGKPQPNLFTFGGGPRACVGEHFAHNLVLRIVQQITANFRLSLINDAEYYKNYKWLPVCRPSKPVNLKFTPISRR